MNSKLQCTFNIFPSETEYGSDIRELRIKLPFNRSIF